MKHHPNGRPLMVGDNFKADVLRANDCGIHAVWFNPHSLETRENELQRTIYALVELPDCLEGFLDTNLHP